MRQVGQLFDTKERRNREDIMENHYTVYKLTDPDGKVYIGVTGKTVEERWNKGRGYSRGTPIREAIRK